MTNGTRILTIPRANPVNAYTMGRIVRDAGLPSRSSASSCSRGGAEAGVAAGVALWGGPPFWGARAGGASPRARHPSTYSSTRRSHRRIPALPPARHRETARSDPSKGQRPSVPEGRSRQRTLRGNTTTDTTPNATGENPGIAQNRPGVARAVNDGVAGEDQALIAATRRSQSAEPSAART